MSLTWIVDTKHRLFCKKKFGSSDARVKPVNLLVYHYTVGPNTRLMRTAVENWIGSPTQSSTHIVTARDPRKEATLQMAALEERTWHAGGSEWRGLKNINSMSIGLDMDNIGWLVKKGGKWLDSYGKSYNGPTPFIDQNGKGWEPYTDESITEICRITDLICEQYPFFRTNLDHLVGHEHIRKIKQDPGPAFPWDVIKEAAASGNYPGKVAII